MDIAFGLWEVTGKGDLSGAPPIPDSLLARLTPAQQAKLQEMLAGRSQPKKYKSCMRPGKLGEGFEKDADGQPTGRCTSTVAVNTSTEYQAEKQCETQDGTSYGAKIYFTLAGRHQATGSVDIVLTRAGGTITKMHHSIDAQWLGADCGTIKDVEMEQ